jgi:hypothetical protein
MRHALRCAIGGMNMEAREPVWEINEATWDRVLRVLIGLAILALVFVGPKTPWGFLGVVPLATGVLGHCLGFKVLGISTCPARGTTFTGTSRRGAPTEPRAHP